jgi:hypothetical protein
LAGPTSNSYGFRRVTPRRGSRGPSEYDLTSTYFEADPPFPEGDKRRFEYSRDHRPDCVQILIAPRFREGRLWW